MSHNCVHGLYVYRSTSLSWLQRVAITRLTLKGCRRPARRDLVCTHTRQLFLRPTSHLLLRCLHQRHSRYNQLRRSMCNLRKRGGGCVHRLHQCTLCCILAGTDARARAAATLEGPARAADATGARTLGRAADTASPEGTRGRAPDTGPKSRRKAVAMFRPPRRRRAPPLHAGVTAHVTGRVVSRILHSTTRAATSRVSST